MGFVILCQLSEQVGIGQMIGQASQIQSIFRSKLTGNDDLCFLHFPLNIVNAGKRPFYFFLTIPLKMGKQLPRITEA